jgi:hypothetical protein
MRDSLLKGYNQYYFIRQFFSDYWMSCGVLNRKRDLEQLIQWAERKRISGVQRWYQTLLLDEEQRLWKYERRSPLAVQIAYIGTTLSQILNQFSQTGYYKGYANQYRHR